MTEIVNIPPLFENQEEAAQFWVDTKRIMNASDPGTGKTRASLEGYRRSLCGRLLVIAPLSILDPAWGNDIRQFLPGFNYAIAHGGPAKRLKAFESGADIVLINHDGVKWLRDNKHLLADFSHCVVDESTAFKNGTSQRSKAMNILADQFEFLALLSGTPDSNSILDWWHQVYLIDRGQRLGNKFWGFRSSTCEPRQVGMDPRAVQWDEKPGAREMVGEMIKDITIRHQFEDCQDIPENSLHMVTLDMPPWLKKQYKLLEEQFIVELEDGSMVNAIHAGSKVKKMLQLLSGALYDAEGNVARVHTERYDLILQMVEERVDHLDESKASLVAYNWQHEVDSLELLAAKKGLRYAIINGKVPVKDRNTIVDRYQKGELDVIFAHPQSAGHGLTLTRGRSTIWASPTYNAEHYVQFNRRIYRAGQKHKTETIRVGYRDSKEIEVYDKLDNKLDAMTSLLDYFNNYTKQVKQCKQPQSN